MKMIDELVQTLIKLNHNISDTMYQDLKYNSLDIKLERNEVNLLKSRFGKYFDFTEKSISIKDLNEIKISELNDIVINNKVVTWNFNKSFDKFKSQIEKRIKSKHIPNNEKLEEIITNGLTKKIEECYLGSTKDEDDTCLIFMKSQFILLFNKRGMFIRSIRKISELDKITCSEQKPVFETKYGNNNELTDFLELYDFNDYLGFNFNIIRNKNEMLVEVYKSCAKCINIDL
jgi:hypothetical protein